MSLMIKQKIIAFKTAIKLIEDNNFGKIYVIEKEIEEIRKRCPHKDTTNHRDPSGNNDSFEECND
jgi:hypothetical protein